MLNFISTKIISSSIVILGTTFLVFLFIHLIPGDPVEVMLGEMATSADRESLRRSLGLDQPFFSQLFNYFNGLLHLDLGTSLHSKKPVTTLLSERFPATLELTLMALMVAVIIAFPLGILSALKKDTIWDVSSITVSLLGISIPNFLLGPLLVIIFSLILGWFPVSGRGGVSALVLPAFTLGTGLAAILSRMIRASLLEVLGEDFMRTARAKGLSERSVILRHALPNSLLPVITLLGLQFGILLGGAVVTEIVFSWPGIGQLTIEAIQKRDYPVLQGCILLISTSFVLVNSLTDVMYGLTDPRVRLKS